MSIFTDTPIIPDVIADKVSGGKAEIARYLVDRAERHYASNPHFARLIRSKGNKGRDMLYAFMEHWLAARHK